MIEHQTLVQLTSLTNTYADKDHLYTFLNMLGLDLIGQEIIHKNLFKFKTHKKKSPKQMQSVTQIISFASCNPNNYKRNHNFTAQSNKITNQDIQQIDPEILNYSVPKQNSIFNTNTGTYYSKKKNAAQHHRTLNL